LALWPCLGVYFGLIALIAVEHRLSHRILRPAEVAERRKYTLISVISPADAMQAGARLFRLHLEMYQPLALAAAIGPRDQFEQYARRLVRGLRYGDTQRCPSSGEDPRNVVAWFGNRLTSAVEEFLREQGIDVDEVLAAPAPDSPTSRGFCPRCEGQY